MFINSLIDGICLKKVQRCRVLVSILLDIFGLVTELLKRKCQVGIWIIRCEIKERTELKNDIWDSFSLEMVTEGISKC